MRTLHYWIAPAVLIAVIAGLNGDPAKDGGPVRFKVTLDGSAPGDHHGVDSGPDGTGEVRQTRMYQLVRQKQRVQDRTFEIEFLDPGVDVFSFTFGQCMDHLSLWSSQFRKGEWK